MVPETKKGTVKSGGNGRVYSRIKSLDETDGYGAVCRDSWGTGERHSALSVAEKKAKREEEAGEPCQFK